MGRSTPVHTYSHKSTHPPSVEHSGGSQSAVWLSERLEANNAVGSGNVTAVESVGLAEAAELEEAGSSIRSKSDTLTSSVVSHVSSRGVICWGNAAESQHEVCRRSRFVLAMAQRWHATANESGTGSLIWAKWHSLTVCLTNKPGGRRSECIIGHTK